MASLTDANELVVLGWDRSPDRFGELVEIERTMVLHDHDKAIRLSQEFNALATSAVRSFALARLAYARDRDVLVRRTAANLEGALRLGPCRGVESLQAMTSSVRLRDLPEQVGALLGDQIARDLYEVACLESELVQKSWVELIERFRLTTESCINELRSRTSDLLDVELPFVAVASPSPPRPLSAWLFRDAVEGATPDLDHPRLLGHFFGSAYQRRRIFAEVAKLAEEQIGRTALECRDHLQHYGEEEFQRIASYMHDQLDDTIDRVLLGMGRAEGLLTSDRGELQLADDLSTTGAACRAADRCLGGGDRASMSWK